VASAVRSRAFPGRRNLYQKWTAAGVPGAPHDDPFVGVSERPAIEDSLLGMLLPRDMLKQKNRH
jgi:hypothetical protein